MFASNVRLRGLELLARHRIREGMELCFIVMEIDKWGKAARIPKCLKALAIYGAAAKPMLPRLRQLEKDMISQGQQPIVTQVSALIRDIENATETVELRSLD